MSKTRGGRRLFTFGGAVKKKLTTAERKLTTALVRPRVQPQNNKGEELVGSHRHKDKKVEAYLEFEKQTIQKQNHLVEAILSPVVEKWKALGSLPDSEKNDFVKKVAALEEQIESANTAEELDGLIKKKQQFEADNQRYNEIKAAMALTTSADKEFKASSAKLNIKKRREDVIQKLEVKIKHLEALKNKKSARHDDKGIDAIDNRMALLRYIIENKLKEGSYHSFAARIARLNTAILEIESKLSPHGERALSANEQNKLIALKKEKASLENQRSQFDRKIREQNRKRQELIKVQAQSNQTKTEFGFFNSPTSVKEDYLSLEKEAVFKNARQLRDLVGRVEQLKEKVKLKKASLNAEKASVSSEVDKRMKVDTVKKTEKVEEPQGKTVKVNLPLDQYKGHVYASHISGRVNTGMPNDHALQQGGLYNMFIEYQSLNRPFDNQTVDEERRVKREFFGFPELEAQFKADQKAAMAKLSEAANAVKGHLPLPQDEGERRAVLNDMAAKMREAAGPVINDLVNVMIAERGEASQPSNEEIEKVAILAVRNYLFLMNKVSYPNANDEEQVVTAELLRMATMFYHEKDVSKGFDEIFIMNLMKGGSLDSLNIYIKMVGADYLRNVLTHNPRLADRLRSTLEAFSEQIKEDAYRETFTPLLSALGMKVPREPRTKAFKQAATKLGRKIKGGIKTSKEKRITPALSHPFGPELRKISGKIGGANAAGDLGGVYVDKNGNLSLYKKDTKHGKVRVAKVIGEGLGGALIDKVASEVMGGEHKDRIAQTELVQVVDKKDDKSGNATYLKSAYIKGYQDDFWVVAYQERYNDYYKEKLANEPDLASFERRIMDYKANQTETLEANIRDLKQQREEMVAGLKEETNENSRENFRIQIQNIDMKIPQLQEKLVKLENNFQKADDVLKKMGSGERPLMYPLLDFLVERKLSAMDRPSGVTNLSSRKVVSDAILRPQNNTGSKQFLRDFTEGTAIRLLVGDYGQHSANKGIAKIKGEYRIVDIDFGAAFSKLNPDVNPYSRTKTGIEPYKFYKNHFLEYDDAIIKGTQMAQAFIKVGQIDKDKLDEWVTASLQEVVKDKFDKTALIKFAKRLGMKDKDLSSLEEKAIFERIEGYMKERISARATSLLHQGYALLLENCYDKENNKVDIAALQKVLTDYPDVAQFARTKFQHVNLVLHSSHIPGRDALIKSIIVFEVNKLIASQALTPKKEEALPDEYDRVATQEVKYLVAEVHKLADEYKQTENTQTRTRLKLAHQGAINTFTAYADAGMMQSPLGLQLRDEIIKMDKKLRADGIMQSPPVKDELMRLTDNKEAPQVKPSPSVEVAPKMRSGTVIVAQNAAKKVKALARRSAPVSGKDSRKLPSSVFFQAEGSSKGKEKAHVPSKEPTNDPTFTNKKGKN